MRCLEGTYSPVAGQAHSHSQQRSEPQRQAPGGEGCHALNSFLVSDWHLPCQGPAFICLCEHLKREEEEEMEEEEGPNTSTNRCESGQLPGFLKCFWAALAASRDGMLLVQPWESPHLLAKGKAPGAQIGECPQEQRTQLVPKKGWTSEWCAGGRSQ